MIQFYMSMILLLLNFLFLLIKHPLSLSLILMIQTFIISIISGMINKNFWFSYILFLIFIGALLILFIYITSLASNEIFNFSYKMIILFFIFMALLSKIPNFFSWKFSNSDMNTYMYYNIMNNTEFIMLFNFPTNLISFLIMLYLLFTLISIIKITKFFKGPLRMMN
nr:NADH dehydrogenase subunit 6 [Basilia ansifera]